MAESMEILVGTDLIEQEQRLSSAASWYHRNRHNVRIVATALKGLEIQSAVICGPEVDINIMGNKETLQSIFKAMRGEGYEPSQRPNEDDEPMTTFSCYWNHPDHDGKFWIYFSSTQCRRVQIGTEMKELPIYETVCD